MSCRTTFLTTVVCAPCIETLLAITAAVAGSTTTAAATIALLTVARLVAYVVEALRVRKLVALRAAVAPVVAVGPACALGWPAAVLAFARSRGEFGATITFAGNIPGVTQTLPLAVFSEMNRADGNAAGLVTVAVVLAAGALAASEWLERRGSSP